MKNKKAEITIEMLIGIVLGIIIVVVLILVFTGKISFVKSNTSCEAQGGSCTLPANCATSRIYSASCPSGKDGEIKPICCMKEAG